MHALTWALVLVAALPAQAGGDGLLAAIARRFAQVEACARTLAVDVEVLVHELDGAPLDPPGRAAVRWATRGGRVFVHVEGLDPDGSRTGPPFDASTDRLYLPGGLTETLDRRRGSWSRDQRSYPDAANLASDLGPGEFLWTFCGARRSSILDRRAPRLVSVEGETPERLIRIEADDRAGTQRIAFDCAERWGFLPRLSRMFARRDGVWMELRSIEIRSARLTRLGWFPMEAALTALRPQASGAYARTLAAYRFGDPELADVAVPLGLAGAAWPRPGEEAQPASLPARGVADPDPIFASGSPLFREPLAGRAGDLDAFLRPLLETRRGPGSDGIEDPRRWVWAAAGVGLGALGLVAAALRKPLWAAVAAGVAALALGGRLGIAMAGPAGVPPDAAARLRALATIDAPAPPASRTLCGVDCLYAALVLAGSEPPAYADLVKLVRPGAHGTTLEALRIAAECVGARPVLTDPRGWVEPPVPLIAHLPPSHFVVIAGLAGGDVAVVDPARGVHRGPWRDVRPLLSPAACGLERAP